MISRVRRLTEAPSKPTRLLFALVAALVVVAQPFSAAAAGAAEPPTAVAAIDPFGCDPEPPSPQGPGGWFIDTPNPIPKPADPFKKNAKTTITEQYGLGGLDWTTYDLGCGGKARSAAADTYTSLANGIRSMNAEMLLGLTGVTLDAAYNPTWMDAITPAVKEVNKGFGVEVFYLLIPFAFMLIGVAAAFLHRKMDHSALTHVAAWLALAFGVGLFAVSWPLLMGDTFHDGLDWLLGAINGAFNGNSGDTARQVDNTDLAVGAVHEAVLWTAWQRGMFGRTDGVADKYGPDLFKAGTLNWHEASIVENDPTGEGKELIEDKQEQWENIAAKVKDENPSAYRVLAGHESHDRMVDAALASLVMWLILPFLVMTAIVLIAGSLMVFLAVMALPLAAPLGAWEKAKGPLRAVFSMVAAAVYAAVMMTAFSGVYVIAVRHLMDGSLLNSDSVKGFWLAVIVLLVLTFVFWRWAKPVTLLRGMLPSPINRGIDTTKARSRWLANKGVNYWIHRRGTKDGTEDAAEEFREQREDRSPARYRTTRPEATVVGPPMPRGGHPDVAEHERGLPPGVRTTADGRYRYVVPEGRGLPAGTGAAPTGPVTARHQAFTVGDKPMEGRIMNRSEFDPTLGPSFADTEKADDGSPIFRVYSDDERANR